MIIAENTSNSQEKTTGILTFRLVILSAGRRIIKLSCLFFIVTYQIILRQRNQAHIVHLNYLFMKKCIFLIAFLLLTVVLVQVHAQSIRNTDWKTFIGDQLNDTLTIHIQKDSSFVTNSAGNVVVRSVCTISGDTLVLKDYEGEFMCPDSEGKYKFRINEGYLILNLISDPCDGRARSVDGVKWKKAGK
jgi:hypothetical protein